ncbi:GerW family sporulation protein [Thermocaproicibacter melissae]|uniref:GerW family sporulation protein n=1 Tax=Thermocaproicibacter melissae TaxID=2966552 RepID=UPI0024B0F18F|nr:GerW family sporulation protein [Thermocaproicibacter melissae]WBY64639.1 GerW family sporulation protein [Thermocaproicibacter melissae]
MSEHPIEGMMDTTLEKIKQMVDVNSVIGDPITAPDGTVIIPVSKVNYGFASGGSDLPVKTSEKQFFGGGTGAGVTITPVAFLVVSNGDIRLMRVELGSTPVDRIIDQAPELINRISSMVGKKKKDNTTASDGTENSPVQE